MSDMKINVFEFKGGDHAMVATGLRAGHVPAVAAALSDFVKAERARFSNGGTSGVGHAAEEFLEALDKARGF